MQAVARCVSAPGSGLPRAPRHARAPRQPTSRRAAVPARPLMVFASAQAEPEPHSFALEQPSGLSQQDSTRDALFARWQLDAAQARQQQFDAAQRWEAWLEQQYAELQPIAGSVRSFTAVSWESLGPAAGPLRLADFLALLSPEQLQEVTLALSKYEALPADALVVLAGFPQLRALSIRPLSRAEVDCSFSQLLEEADEAAGAAAVRSLQQLTKLSIEWISGWVHGARPLLEAVLCLPQLEQLDLDVGAEYDLQDMVPKFAASLPNLRHLRLVSYANFEAGGTPLAPLPRPAAFPRLESYEYSLSKDDYYGFLSVEGTDRKCGGLVRFTSGELAVQDAYSSMDQDGIEALQPLVDALLPAGQELRALVVEGLCGGYELSVDCSCRQLVTATRLELRSCILDYGELLRQAPNLRELVIDAGDFDEEQIPLPGAALPAGLMRLVLESIPLEKPAKWPAMPGLADLSMSFDAFRQLIHLKPCPLAAATSLRSLSVQDASALVVQDVEALAAALPGLHKLELYSSWPGRTPVVAPSVLEHLSSLLPGLEVCVGRS